MPKKRTKDLAAKDLKPGLRFRYRGADVEILREREATQDRFGLPQDRWWSRDLGTGQEGYVSLGPAGKLYNVELLSVASTAKAHHHATKKSPAQLDREIDALIGARPRRLVQVAAKMTKNKMAKSWLSQDERGTFEQLAARLLEESTSRARELGMTDAAVDEAIAIEVLLAALKAVERREKSDPYSRIGSFK